MALVGKSTEFLFGVNEQRCDDIPEAACTAQPHNLSIHLASLTATKTGDGLLDPKLVLTWLLGAIGAPTAAIGAIVPAREAFSLLPQLLLAEPIRRMSRRKWVWAAASVTQGVLVLAIALVALALDGAAAGWAIVGLVVLFGIARSCASVSYKDVLGQTVAKSRRGTVTGTAASFAATVILAFGLLLWAGAIPLSSTSITVVLMLGGTLWIIAGLVFTTLVEEPGNAVDPADPERTAARSTGIRTVVSHLTALRSDPQLGRFVAARSLLTVTAIAPPYLLAASRSGGSGLGELGPFVIASATATILGGRMWGQLSDRSSRRVLIGSAGASTALFISAAIGTAASLLDRTWLASGLLFLMVLAYQGVRLGRSTHLVDMAEPGQRSVYTAVSNTVVGIVILATGSLGALSDVIGIDRLFALFALMSAIAAVVSRGLEQVQ